MQALISADHQLFLLINHLPHTMLFDFSALVLSGFGSAVVLWVCVGAWMFLVEERKDHWFFLQLVFAGGGSCLLTEIVFKPWFSRLRPLTELGALVIQDTAGGYSFPSGHATFAFAFATVLAAKEPKARFWFYLLACAVAFSRIYLGKHYPLDVVVGALVGWGIGIAAIRIAKMIQGRATA